MLIFLFGISVTINVIFIILSIVFYKFKKRTNQLKEIVDFEAFNSFFGK